MADTDQTKKEVKFFRTEILGLNVIVGDPKDGDVAPESERFVAYEIESKFGESVRVAYLKTSNPVAIEKLSKDSNVIEVDADEYKEYTNPKNDKVKRARV